MTPTQTAPLSLAEFAQRALAAARGAEPAVGVVIVETVPPDAACLGRRMVVDAEGCQGTLGCAELDAHAALCARELLRERASAATRHIQLPGAVHTVYLEVFRPPPELVIVGAGHVARPLSRVGAMLGFRVSVLDDRPEFATRERFPDAERVIRADFSDPFRGLSLGADTYLVLVTRGHKFDFDALRDALRRPVALPYIGMIGSRRRTRAALDQLARDGISPERLLRVHAPIGLDIGAETPEEIAIAVAAEIIRARRGGTGAPLRDQERVVQRWIENRDNDR